jgi:hypothetical protein
MLHWSNSFKHQVFEQAGLQSQVQARFRGPEKLEGLQPEAPGPEGPRAGGFGVPGAGEAGRPRGPGAPGAGALGLTGEQRGQSVLGQGDMGQTATPAVAAGSTTTLPVSPGAEPSSAQVNRRGGRTQWSRARRLEAGGQAGGGAASGARRVEGRAGGPGRGGNRERATGSSWVAGAGQN